MVKTSFICSTVFVFFSIPMRGLGPYPSFHFLSILFCGQPEQQIPQFCKFFFFFFFVCFSLFFFFLWGVVVVSYYKVWSSGRCPWCNGYRRRKWTRRYEFKSWTRLIAFHIALIPLGKVRIQLLSLQLWVNSRTD